MTEHKRKVKQLLEIVEKLKKYNVLRGEKQDVRIEELPEIVKERDLIFDFCRYLKKSEKDFADYIIKFKSTPINLLRSDYIYQRAVESITTKLAELNLNSSHQEIVDAGNRSEEKMDIEYEDDEDMEIGA